MPETAKQKKQPLKKILIISNAGKILAEFRRRWNEAPNHRSEIVLPKSEALKHLDGLKEMPVNVDLTSGPDVTKLLKSQNFDAIFVNMHEPDSTVMKNILHAMKVSNTSRLITVVKQTVAKTKFVVQAIRESTVNYTIIRYADLNKKQLLSYQAKANVKPVADATVSTASIADLAFQTIGDPLLHQDADLAIVELPYK